jgi:AraC-like DNA-binding protein
MDRRIFYLCEHLSRNLEYQWTVEEMSEILKLSVRHFQKLFKSEVKSSPMNYLRDMRLEKARQLLANADSFLTIKEIRLAVGILNDSHFTRDFKKKYGVTPTEYRKGFWDKIQTENEIGKK